MKPDFPPAPAACADPPPEAARYPAGLLAELLALNEEMAVQLRLELLSTGSADFLTDMIEQHERAAALLRAQLQNGPADAAAAGLIPFTLLPSAPAFARSPPAAPP